MIKIIIITCLLFTFKTLLPSDQRHSDKLDFTEWKNLAEFKTEIESLPDDYYPIIIQCHAPLGGGGGVYRMLITENPNKTLNHQAAVGLDDERFNDVNSKLTETGYTLISHQVVQLRHKKSNQAVWVKSKTPNNGLQKSGSP